MKDKVAIVTGVSHSRGIGYATAKAMGREGSSIVIADISDKVFECERNLQESGYKVMAFRVDLSRSEEVDQMVKVVLGKFGGVDILANIAGVQPRVPNIQESERFSVPFVDLTEKDLKRALSSNLMTTFNCIKAVLPGMIEQRYGKIVNMSSVTGPLVSQPGLTAYAIAKAGVTGLTHTLALEVAEYGINVNQICPGSIDTGLELDEIERECAEGIAMRRLGKPEEVANLVVFLASDEASYMTGHMVVIDGGNILQELHPPLSKRTRTRI